MGFINDLQTAIVSHFNSTVTSLPTLRIGRQPKGTDRPYAVLDQIDNSSNDAFSATRWADNWVFQFSAFGSRSEVVSALEDIHDAFNRQSLTLTTGTCRSIMRVSTFGPVLDPNEDGKSNNVYMGVSRYRFIVDN